MSATIADSSDDDERKRQLIQALGQLEQIDPQSGQCARLSLLAGLTDDEIAQTLSLPSRTVKRNMHIAGAWLSWKLK